jgi:hypothetical protein
MGIFSKISKAFKKVVKVSTGGLIGGHSNSGQSTTEETAPAPELGFVNADTQHTTESESEKQQLTKGKKRGKKSLKVNISGAGGTGRNIV